MAFNRSRDIACAVGRWAGPGCRGGPTAEPEPEVEVEVPLDRIRSSAERRPPPVCQTQLFETNLLPTTNFYGKLTSGYDSFRSALYFLH